MQAMAI